MPRQGKIKIRQYFSNGECSIILNISRENAMDEHYSISDQGKMMSMVMSNGSYPRLTNSRSTGSRIFTLLPRVKKKITYTLSPETNEVIINLVNGEKMILNSENGEIKDITGTKWHRDKAMRNYMRGDKIYTQDAYSESCSNCGLKYDKVEYDRFEYVEGGFVIDSTEKGIVFSTKMRRGGDSRLPKLWGTNQSTYIKDKNGLTCRIENQFIYKYFKDYRGEIDGMWMKFVNDFEEFPTRTNKKETVYNFLTRVCIKTKGLKDFDLSFLDPKSPAYCHFNILETPPAVTNLVEDVDKVIEISPEKE